MKHIEYVILASKQKAIADLKAENEQSKETKRRNAELENQVMELTKENTARFQQLEQDYRDVEAELNEITAIKVCAPLYEAISVSFIHS